MWQAKWIDHRWHCPRCGVRPTLYLWDRTSFCVNCKLHWQAEQPPGGAHVPVQTLPQQTIEFVFTPEELERLTIYRRAVAAGFFTDDLPRLPQPIQS